MKLHPLEERLYDYAFRAEKDPKVRALLVKAMQGMFALVAFERRTGGERLFRFAKQVAVRFGRYRAPRLREELGIDPNDMADLARIQDWEDRAFGVTGHWVAKDKTSASRCETACPYAKAASYAPELCTDLIHALEVATFRELNPRYE